MALCLSAGLDVRVAAIDEFARRKPSGLYYKTCPAAQKNNGPKIGGLIDYLAAKDDITAKLFLGRRISMQIRRQFPFEESSYLRTCSTSGHFSFLIYVSSRVSAHK